MAYTCFCMFEGSGVWTRNIVSASVACIPLTHRLPWSWNTAVYLVYTAVYPRYTALYSQYTAVYCEYTAVYLPTGFEYTGRILGGIRPCTRRYTAVYSQYLVPISIHFA